jgi:hypothetical protein|tara:strand:+ start:39 stop:353 length:315 start_codon:yes stop_codon:yes gene_type:complete
MKKDEFDMLAQDIWMAIINTREQGQDEYARTKDDVLANFKRVASWQNRSQESVLMTYMLKHIDGILSYVNGYESQRENIRGRITDVMVYCMLLWAMIEDNEKRV